MILIKKQRSTHLDGLSLFDQHFRNHPSEIIRYQSILSLQRLLHLLLQSLSHQRNVQPFFQFDDFRHVQMLFCN